MNEIVKIPLYKIKSFKDHPYKVNEDEAFNELKDSIKANGLLNPLIVRKKDNTYELISGHRRKLVLEKLGCLEADCIIKELEDELIKEEENKRFLLEQDARKRASQKERAEKLESLSKEEYLARVLYEDSKKITHFEDLL